jgi:integrase
MLYKLALGSGLRANELRSLTRASFHLEGAEPAVTVGAAYSKHRREDIQLILPDLAALLKAHLANKLPNAPAFNVPPSYDTADMLKADLTDARTAWLESRRMPASPHRNAQDALEGEDGTFLAYRDSAGRYADFHALRHSFITSLVMGGVNPKEAQSLARHSVIGLTLDRYTHQYAGNLTAALNVLPDLSSPTPKAGKMTGTDGRTVGENPPY